MMKQAPRPSSGTQDHLPAVAPPRSDLRDHDNSSNTGTNNLELVDLSSNALIEGILGPNKDGRVRNPVPSKLKGKTDQKQGNFGVMHMGMSPGGKKVDSQGREAAAERDAAARRTSENTASRAKAAQQEKYVPPKKRGLEATLTEATRITNRGSPFARDDRRQARPLAPDETKMEQARLLTLLRSINPVTVVDQICKAVAYFGGIPGAPPPEDGIFPESANTRETGALFIGWLAEIFPDVSARSPEVPKTLLDAAKGRGRPSKDLSTTPSRADMGTAGGELPNSRNGYGYGPAVSAPAWGLPQNLAEANPQAPTVPDTGPQVGGAVEQSRQPEQPPPLTPLTKSDDTANNAATSASKRRRGRPKGSTNKKGKGDGVQGENPLNNAESDGQPQPVAGQLQQSPQVIGTSLTTPQQIPETAPYHPVITNQTPILPPTRPLQYPYQSWQNNPPKNQVGQPNAEELNLSREERAVLEAFRNQADGGAALPSPVVSTKGPAEPGRKRKRPPPKPKAPVANKATNAGNVAKVTNPANPTPAANFPVQPPQPAQQQNVPMPIINNEAAMSIAKDASHWAPVATTTTTTATTIPTPIVPPPAKKPRQRKPKAPTTNDFASRNQNTSIVNSATPPIAPSTIPDSTAGSSQQSISVSRPPAEGLEAHYERFANLQQQNGRSNTPTIPQQQHVRQPSKPSSVPPQQTTPQIPQQMQHQKSQQGSQQAAQRDDQKLTQTATSRSNTGYYNQRTQSGSSGYQQYPSHQPSQLYGAHSASPQMSNNSYRTSSSHTMAQASPQFSQAENPYRTASPHTISQPSPSFSQNDNYRSSTTQPLAQPSPSYSQTENNYRTASTHSMAQPSSSYTTSRSHTQQSQPSHQSHYSQFPDSAYMDLPAIEPIGQSSSTTGSLGGYGQGIGVGLGGTSASHSRSMGSTGSLYGTSSGLNNSFDTGAADLLRVSRGSTGSTNSLSQSAYGNAGASALGGAFDTTSASENDLREKLLRNMGRR